MRAADAIEKITLTRPEYLQNHKKEILNRCQTAIDIELKWHLALLVSRLQLTKKEFWQAWNLVTAWASNKSESKIVRVNSIQAMFNLLQQNIILPQEFNDVLTAIEKENIPSLSARIRKLHNLRR